MNTLLTRLADSVAGAHGLEDLTRQMLELIEAITGMESTYLTAIDTQRGVQHVLFARNQRELKIPEGLSVTWSDTLCRRALEQNQPYTDNVENCWGDSVAARALGIKTYLSQPVRTTDGELFGTLCAASAGRVPVRDDTIKLLTVFSRLIAFEVDRGRRLRELERVNEQLASHARVDPLTGLVNRRVLIEDTQRLLAQGARSGTAMQVAFIDLDDFKRVNDTHWHAVGDRLLVNIASRLALGIRASDLLGRYGGDEFVVVTQGADPAALSERLAGLTVGRYDCNGVMVDYSGASIGVVESEPGELDALALLRRADAAMYAAKRVRRVDPAPPSAGASPR